jgi:predicted nucleic acid-binding protein
MGFLIDTCIWVDLERGRISPADVETYTKDEPVYISPITIAELTFGLEMASNAAIRSHRTSALERLKRKPLLVIDEVTGEIFGKLAAELRGRRKQTDYRVQDLWLASQAIQHNFRFLTMNTNDFKDIPGIQLAGFGK